MGMTYSPNKHIEMLVAENGPLAPVAAQLAADAVRRHGTEKAHKRALYVVQAVTEMVEGRNAALGQTARRPQLSQI